MPSCVPFAIAKITGMPVRSVEIILRNWARTLAEDLGPDQAHITLRGDQIGVSPAVVTELLNRLGFSVDWTEPDPNTIVADMAEADYDGWIILWIKSGDDRCHCAALRGGKIYDNCVSALFPQIHQYSGKPIELVGFVSRRDANENELNEAA